MIVTKNVSIRRILAWSWHFIALLFVFVGGVSALYAFDLIALDIPWLPVSVIGTAVAFYVGFKNNSAYDRMWEARKIWGAIVNSSRTWGMQVDGFITDQFIVQGATKTEIATIKKRLIYRHIAWLYALRSQLLIPTSWEHISQSGKSRRQAEQFQNTYGIGLVRDEETEASLHKFLNPEEHDRLINHVNTATQIINEQSRDLTRLRKQGLIDDFRHMSMANLLGLFYDHQGKAERIKKFPLPRQYSNMSRIFVGIFIFLLPFSMVPELMKLGDLGFWMSIPITVLIAWIYVMMELVGDFSENPFQGMANDIPMLSLCRTIEIDMREMLGETDLPPKIEAKSGVLM